MSLLKVSALCFLLLGCSSFAKDSRAEVQTASFVELNKYIGKWYEVASIPQSFQKQCVANTTAEYSLLENGMIKVFNSCDTNKGARDSAEGRAKIVDSKTNSKLKVTFVKIGGWIFAFGGNYWILDIDSGYHVALIGDPSRDYAWILSRSPELSAAQWVEAEKTYKAQGYDTCKILTSIQSSGVTKRIPLCDYVAKNL